MGVTPTPRPPGDQAASPDPDPAETRSARRPPWRRPPWRRPPWRRRLAAVTFVGALVLHAALIVNGGADPHKRFGFRPFEDSDVWQVEIVRVDADGHARPVNDGTWVYDWNELVGAKGLFSPWRRQHARGGARNTVELLDRALDWVVRHIPDDPDTVRLDARVTVVHNRHDPRVILLRGDEREPGS